MPASDDTRSKMTPQPVILAIDVGSSSARAGIFDADLKPIKGTFHQETYSLITGHDGRAELDPEVLIGVVTQCIDRSLVDVIAVAAVGISTFWHSVMGIDRDGSPTTNVLTWADTRAARTVQQIASETDERELHQRTGARLHSSYPLAKIRWLTDTHADVAERTHRWVSFPEYLQLRILGRLSVSVSMASGTGLLNRTQLDWDTEAIQIAGTRRQLLSRISDEPISGLEPDYAARWPKLADAKWFPAIGDGAANNLGSDAVHARHPALMIGTTGALRLLTDSNPLEMLPENLWHYRLDRRHNLLGGALSEGGGVLDWLFRSLQLPDDEVLDQQIADSEPDSHGLTVLPYLAGERSPGWNSSALGTIHGLRFDSRPVEIVQATMESIAYSCATILDALKPLLEEPVEIVATGNGLRKNRAWIRIIADVLQYPLLLPRQTEASLRGAALHALRHLGIEPAATSIADAAERFEPNVDRADAYSLARERHEALYRRLVAQKPDE